MSEVEIRRMRVSNALLNRQIKNLSAEIAAERERTRQAQQQLDQAEAFFLESIQGMNGKVRTATRERDKATARKSELSEKVKQNRREDERRQTQGSIWVMSFLAITFVMTFMWMGDQIAFWQVLMPLAAAFGVGSVSGLTDCRR